MKKAMKILVPILLAIAVIGCMIWYLFVYDRDFARDMLLQQARYFEREGNHEVAAWLYDHAYAYADQDENVAIELAEQYKSIGNYTKAESTLSGAIADGATAELYVALCETYVEQDKLLDAVNMLDNIPDAAIKAELDAMRPAAPTPNFEPNFYTQYISVEITAASGDLYVSYDGEYPSIQEDLYAGPVTLSAGETAIYALSVGEDGLVSPLVILGYTIGGVVEEVTFADPAVEAEVRSILGVSEDHVLFTNELWNITEFVMPDGAQTFTDLALLPYLRSLTIQNGISEELSSLSALSHLEKLIIVDTRISQDDLAVIAALPKLTSLTLSDCGLSSVEPLSAATGLTYLDLSYNTVRNVTALSGMTNLETLYLQHNAMTDLSELSGLSNLQTLDLSYNSIPSIAPICGITGLKRLDVSYNLLTDLGAVNNLTALTQLRAAHNGLTGVDQLASNLVLEVLDVSNNSLTDISALQSLTGLRELNFSYNAVTELPAFAKDCALVSIDGSQNQLTSLEALSGLKNLNEVLMDYNTEIKSVSPLADCPVLILVNVYGTQVSEVSMLTDQSIVVNYDPT